MHKTNLRGKEKTMFRNTKAFAITVVLTLALCLPLSLAAQAVVVTGTGDPTVDIPSVQAAVDQGGNIVLMGHFSFDAPPTTPDGSNYNRMVTISKPVSIWGALDAAGNLPDIEGGYTPFFIEAPGQAVTIQGLRFIRPVGVAVWVYTAGGLVISNCRIEGVVTTAGFAGLKYSYASGIWVVPDQAESLSGTISISNNDIDVGGTAGDQTQAINIGVLGSPDKQVDLHVSGNTIRNVTERVIDVKSVAGRVYIDRNVVTTGATAGPSNGVTPNVINVVDCVSPLIAHNTILSEWATGAPILVQGNTSEAGAVVVDNDVTMPAPDGTTFGANSAGIMITGFAQSNGILNNRIRGRARAALVVAVKGKGIPGNNTFVSNDLSGFQSSLANVYLDTGVTSTVIVGQIAKIEDHGVGTVVVPMSGVK
jgi:hypothetical protein